MSITVSSFGALPDGRSAERFTIKNNKGSSAILTNYGAILLGLEMPDSHGVMADVTLGFDSLDEYLAGSNPYFGATVGRFANRINGGRFSLEGLDYSLALNNGRNHLHGGVRGFDKVLWGYELMDGESGSCIRFCYISPNGEEQYPGTLSVSVTYELTDDNELIISYEAETDKTTIINLTNHTYFNLSGGESETILDHELELCADNYTPVNEELIPTGEVASVSETPLDFRKPKFIGRDISHVVGGYDHNYILSEDLDYDVRVSDPLSGRIMEMRTTEPAVQLYTGNFLKKLKGRNGSIYCQHAGVCLEAQHYPDSPNQPQFPSVVLNPGETYRQTTSYRFSAISSE